VTLLLAVSAAPACAVIRVVDDTGKPVSVAQPARRIVSLAPHVTEMLFAAGAGSYVLGASVFSDFPDAARQIPRVGGAQGLDLEFIAALRPDLVVAWHSGNPAWSLEAIERLGIPVFRSEPQDLEDVATNIERLGQLAGSAEAARRASASFRRRHQALRTTYMQRQPVSVFFQVWDQPLMTVGRAHLISRVIKLCGGVNVFAALPSLTAKIGVEAVLRAQPQVIIAAGPPDSRALERWRRWPQLDAVRGDHLFLIPHERIARHTPRVLDGAEQLCQALEEARGR
jgi:iron complex transport system substrate-binding protein